jgi:hypothetical protein
LARRVRGRDSQPRRQRPSASPSPAAPRRSRGFPPGGGRVPAREGLTAASDGFLPRTASPLPLPSRRSPSPP